MGRTFSILAFVGLILSVCRNAAESLADSRAGYGQNRRDLD